MPRQPIRVHIFNQTYTLLTDGDEAEVQAIAYEIDELMTSIANRASSGDSTRVAVLACLHLADKLKNFGSVEFCSARLVPSLIQPFGA
jgi:cell division protein ZapA